MVPSGIPARIRSRRLGPTRRRRLTPPVATLILGLLLVTPLDEVALLDEVELDEVLEMLPVIRCPGELMLGGFWVSGFDLIADG